MNDGFANVIVISNQYKTNVKYFKLYIKNLNKTRATALVANMLVYFNPIIMRITIGVVP